MSKLMPLSSLVDMCRKFTPSAGVLLHFAFMAHKQTLSHTSSDKHNFDLVKLRPNDSPTCFPKLDLQYMDQGGIKRTAPSIGGICSRTSKAPLKNNLIPPKASDMACLDQAKTKIIQLPHQILTFLNTFQSTYIVALYYSIE